VLSGIPDGITVIKIGLGAAVGLGTSAVWSVWEIERAETRAEIERMERAMLADLDDTHVQREQSGARLLHATLSGLGPIIGIIVPLIPFAFEGTLLTMEMAAVIAVGLGIGVLSAFGAYMGSISGQRWYVAAARMGLAGLVVALINLFLPG
jgi:predicted membrane protein (TIGR00267 family)